MPRHVASGRSLQISEQINSTNFLQNLSQYCLLGQRPLLTLEHALKIDPITPQQMSKGSGAMATSTQADDKKMADMDHAEVHYFNRY